jgi:hypothetical protein
MPFGKNINLDLVVHYTGNIILKIHAYEHRKLCGATQQIVFIFSCLPNVSSFGPIFLDPINCRFNFFYSSIYILWLMKSLVYHCIIISTGIHYVKQINGKGCLTQ